jgi:hypothetical protein
VFWRSNDPDSALSVLRQGQATLIRLVQLAPDNARWKSDLAWFNGQIAVLSAQVPSK